MTDHDDKSGVKRVDDPPGDSSEPRPRREDEYADHAVHDLPQRKSASPPEEKKVVIPAREAETLRAKHGDFPQLAARVAEQRAETPRAAEEWVEPAPPKEPRVESNTAWVDDPPSFDPDDVPRADPSQPAQSSFPTARSGVGRFLVYLLLAGAGALAFLLVTGRIHFPGSASPEASATTMSIEEPPATPSSSASSSVTAIPSSPPSPTASATASASSKVRGTKAPPTR